MILTRYAFAIAMFAARCTPNSAEAQIDAQVIKTGKAATALVVLPSGRGFGTAFCNDEDGYFLTNEHVAQWRVTAGCVGQPEQTVTLRIASPPLSTCLL